MVRAYFAMKGKHCIPYMKHIHGIFLSLFIIKVLKSFIPVQLFRSPVLSWFFYSVIVYTVYCITAISVLLCKYTEFVLLGFWFFF